MSFDLRIHFSGLLMYVPDQRQTRARMHMLLPATHHHDAEHSGGGHGDSHGGMHDVEQHFAGIVYDSAHETMGSIAPTREYVFVPFDGGLLDLTDLPPAGPIHLGVPREIASIDAVMNPVPHDVVDSATHAALTARVTVSAGAITDCSLGGSFVLPGSVHSQPMTDRSEWTIRGVTTTVGTGAGAIDGLPERVVRADGTKLPNLFPIGDTIHINVVHFVPAEFPPKGRDFLIAQEGRPAPHFASYYAICTPRNGKEDVPRAGSELQVHFRHWPEKGDGESPGGTCIQTTGGLAP